MDNNSSHSVLKASSHLLDCEANILMTDLITHSANYFYLRSAIIYLPSTSIKHQNLPFKYLKKIFNVIVVSKSMHASPTWFGYIDVE